MPKTVTIRLPYMAAGIIEQQGSELWLGDVKTEKTLRCDSPPHIGNAPHMTFDFPRIHPCGTD